MREHCKVSPKFWIGKSGKEMKARGSDTQLISLYLMTSPHSNMIGLYFLPLQYLSYETGIPIEGVKEALQCLTKIEFCDYDTETEFVFVKEMAKHQVGEGLKETDKRTNGVRNLFSSLPSNPFKGTFLEKYSKDFHLSDLLEQHQKEEKQEENNPSEGPSKGSNDSESNDDKGSIDEELDPSQDVIKGSNTKNPTPSKQGEGEGEGEGEDLLLVDAKDSDDPPDEDYIPPKQERIPYQKIVDAYHKYCPTMPRVMELTATRKKYIKGRWSSGQMPDLETWENYFQFCDESKFLRGDVAQRDKKPFLADLEWLTKEGNFVKVFERRYHKNG